MVREVYFNKVKTTNILRKRTPNDSFGFWDGFSGEAPLLGLKMGVTEI